MYIYIYDVEDDEGQTQCQQIEGVRSALHSEECAMNKKAALLLGQLRLVEQNIECSTYCGAVPTCVSTVGTRTPGTPFRVLGVLALRAKRFQKKIRERRERTTTEKTHVHRTPRRRIWDNL